HGRSGRGGQPERGPAAVAGRGGGVIHSERADPGTGDSGGRPARWQLAHGARRSGAAPDPTGHRRRDFFGRKPVLMVVEPESLCWITGRQGAAADRAAWAAEIAQLSALESVM